MTWTRDGDTPDGIDDMKGFAPYDALSLQRRLRPGTAGTERLEE
ncbi:hypothetical protein [Rhodococcus sp. F64268]|nr:hypothetical protein [Rhodococcus sp. F64268]